MDLSKFTPEQIAAFMAQMQAAQGQQAAPQQQPQQPQPPAYPTPGAYQPPAAYQPPSPPVAYQPPAMPASYPVPMPQGAQLPPVGAASSADVITDLPPPSLPEGTYDFEVKFMEKKSGTSDKGNNWENLNYQFTVLAGPFAGQSATVGLSLRFTKLLHSLAEACRRPITRDARGKVNFNVRGLDGCRVCAEVTYDKNDYTRIGSFKPIAAR